MAGYTEATIDEIYVSWLYRMVEEAPNDWHTHDTLHLGPVYSKLMEAMYRTEFVPLVDYDQNREADGIALRDRFIFETGYETTAEFRDAPCSLLEMIIGISNRMAFNMDSPLKTVFWRLISNLGLKTETDDYFDEPRVDEILDTLNNRTYDELGNGGLFPLKKSNRDQRTLEIMFQMYEYVSEVYNN